MAVSYKPHAVCLPCPAQGHINAMLKLAKLLHHKGFHITFVNTEYNHKRLIKSRGPDSVHGLPDFCFRPIPDGLWPSDAEVDADATQDVAALCESTDKHCLAPFRELLADLGSCDDVPRVSCIVYDGVMSFALDAAEELGIPSAMFWATSACAFLGFLQYPHLIERGLTPFKDWSYLTNGHLDTIIDWIPGIKEIRLKDMPSFIRTTNPEDFMVHFVIKVVYKGSKASAIILNTFDELEKDVLNALASILPLVFSIGPLHSLVNQISDKTLDSIGSNLWKEEPQCLQWLDSKKPKSVVYINFGSVTVMTSQQLVEFAWGLANSNQTFLWIIRHDLVKGESAILPNEFVEETKERGLLAGWCAQEEVLNHPSVGGFLTHCGWNSTIESLSGGIPMICWPFFADQQTNCRFSCNEWGVGMEIDNDVKRDEVESLVRELMEGEKGKEVRNKALDWKKKCEEAISPSGSSSLNLDKLIKEVLLRTI